MRINKVYWFYNMKHCKINFTWWKILELLIKLQLTYRLYINNNLCDISRLRQQLGIHSGVSFRFCIVPLLDRTPQSVGMLTTSSRYSYTYKTTIFMSFASNDVFSESHDYTRKCTWIPIWIWCWSTKDDWTLGDFTQVLSAKSVAKIFPDAPHLKLLFET